MDDKANKNDKRGKLVITLTAAIAPFSVVILIALGPIILPVLAFAYILTILLFCLMPRLKPELEKQETPAPMEPTLPQVISNTNLEPTGTLAISNIQQGIQNEKKHSVSEIENNTHIVHEETQTVEIQFTLSSASSETISQETVNMSTTQNKSFIAQQEDLSARIQMLEQGLSQQQENLAQHEIRTSNLEHNVRQNQEKIANLENKTEDLKYGQPISSNLRQRMIGSSKLSTAVKYTKSPVFNRKDIAEPEFQKNQLPPMQ